MSQDHMDYLEHVALSDVTSLREKERSYGSSWKKRGGVGAYMMLARKWDRLEKFVEEQGWDIFKAVEVDNRAEGVIDDIRDLRRYLMLVEAELLATGTVLIGTRGDQPSGQEHPFGYDKEVDG